MEKIVKKWVTLIQSIKFHGAWERIVMCVFTLNPDAYVFQASLFQQSFRDVSVLDELEETVQFGAVEDLRNKKVHFIVDI